MFHSCVELLVWWCQTSLEQFTMSSCYELCLATSRCTNSPIWHCCWYL